MSLSNLNEQSSKELKVVVVGDGYIGKTWYVKLKQLTKKKLKQS